MRIWLPILGMAALLAAGGMIVSATRAETPARPATAQQTSTNKNTTRPGEPEADQPGTQCQGVQRFEWALAPHSSDWVRGGVMATAARWTVQPAVCQVGTGAGVACRGASFQPLPPTASMLELVGDNLVFSGIKPAEDGSGLIFRFYNPTESPAPAEIRTRLPVAAAEEVRLDETPQRGLAVEDRTRVKLGEVGAKKIVTVKLIFAP